MKSQTALLITAIIIIGLFYVAYCVGNTISSIHYFAPYALLLGWQVYLASQNRENVSHIVGSIIGLLIIACVPYEYASFMSGCMFVFPPLVYIKRMAKQQ